MPPAIHPLITNGYPIGGNLIREWTAARLRAAIYAADSGIRAALRSGDVDLAMTLISRKIGQRICAGDLSVVLKAPPPQF